MLDASEDRPVLAAALAAVLAAGIAAAMGTGCGVQYILSGKPQAVVQADLHLPRGARVAVVPLTLYGYAKEQRLSISNNAYATQLAAMLKAGFHVVERSLVEKAVDDYARNKTFNKTVGAQGTVYQESGEEVEKIIDLVDIGKTTNARLVFAGSLQYVPGMMSSAVEARLRVTDVTTGEMICNCESAGPPSVLEQCAESMAQQLSVRMSGVAPGSFIKP